MMIQNYNKIRTGQTKSGHRQIKGHKVSSEDSSVVLLDDLARMVLLPPRLLLLKIKSTTMCSCQNCQKPSRLNSFQVLSRWMQWILTKKQVKALFYHYRTTHLSLLKIRVASQGAYLKMLPYTSSTESITP